MGRRNLSELRRSGMSAVGTKREFSPERLEGRKPPHCRRSGLNVGSPLHFRPDSESRRRATHDPKRPFKLGMVVVCNADKLAVHDSGSLPSNMGIPSGLYPTTPGSHHQIGFD